MAGISSGLDLNKEEEDGGPNNAERPESSEFGAPPAKLLRLPLAKPETSKRPAVCLEKPVEEEEDILCFTGEKCLFGSQCPWQHDIHKYIATKLPDLEGHCVHFSLFGMCPFGLTCRFGGDHLGLDFQNLVNKELWAVHKGKSAVRNRHMEEATAELKAFPFHKSEEYLQCLVKAEQKVPSLFYFKWDFSAAAANVSQKIPQLMPPKSLAHSAGAAKTVGVLTDEDLVKLRPCEKKKLDFHGKLYLSPLAKCGNLPFRRICKQFGADITCSEVISSKDLYHGKLEECAAFFHRHETEDLFGIQLEGSAPEYMVKCAEFLNERIQVDFVDINAESVMLYEEGRGCALMSHPITFERIVRGMDYVLNVPVTVKLRSGIALKKNLAHSLIPRLRHWGAAMVTLHGRPKEVTFKTSADWNYIERCAKIASPMPLFGSGDIFSFEDAVKAKDIGVSGITIARAALVKPWVFTEIKEQRHWDISARERLDIIKGFTDYGLEYWGTDTKGVETTRAALLEWLQFLCRYIPVGLLKKLPPKFGSKHPLCLSGDYLEVLMSSQKEEDMVKISEMFLGPVPPGFTFDKINQMDFYAL